MFEFFKLVTDFFFPVPFLSNVKNHDLGFWWVKIYSGVMFSPEFHHMLCMNNATSLQIKHGKFAIPQRIVNEPLVKLPKQINRI